MKTIREIVESMKTKQERAFAINILNDKLWDAMLAERSSGSGRGSTEVAVDAERLVVAWWNRKENHRDAD